ESVASPEFVQLLSRVPDDFLIASDVKYAVVFTDGSGRGIRDFIGDEELEVARGQAARSIRTVNVDGSNYRVIAVRASEEAALILAQSLEPTQRTLDRLGLVFW